jgi:RecG-like helicase
VTAVLDASAATIVPVRDVRWRQRVEVEGHVHSLRVRPWADVPTLEVVLTDGTGGITLVFLGRRRIAALDLGTRLRAEGMVGANHHRLAILNPAYTLLR